MTVKLHPEGHPDYRPKSGNRRVLLVRDQTSYDLARNNFDGVVRLCPDMAFCLGAIARPCNPTRSCVLLLRTDKHATDPPAGVTADKKTEHIVFSVAIKKPVDMRAKSAESIASDTLFAVATHKFDRAINRNIRRINDQLGRDCKFIVHYDATSIPDMQIPALGCPVISFSFDRIRAKFPHLIHASILPGNKYAAYVELLPVFPEVKYFWFIEYDVRFSGNWRTLLEACSRSDADMLGCHIRTKQEIPDWDWWPSIQNMHDPQRQLPGVRAFTWTVRLSRRSLELIAKRCIEEGWTGHLEGLLPSLLCDAGMRIEEIGGRGPFTPAERRGLFYSSEYGISSPSRNGDFGLGSNRFGPPLLFWGARRNRLYHPVKTSRSLRTLARDILSLVRHRRDSTMDLLRRVLPGGHL